MESDLDCLSCLVSIALNIGMTVYITYIAIYFYKVCF